MVLLEKKKMPAKLKFNKNLEASNKLDDTLDSTDYKLGQIIDLYYKNCKEFVEQLGDDEIEKVNAEIIGEGKGFCSQIFKITLNFGKRKKQTFIAKISTDKQWDKLTSNSVKIDPKKTKALIAQMHNCECDSYELLKKLDGIPAPYSYYSALADTENAGLLIMEDVSLHGKLIPVYESVTINQCMDVARLIADFQAQLNFMPDQSWRRKFSFNVQTTDIVEAVVSGMILKGLKYKDEELTGYIKEFANMDLKKLAKFTIEDFTGQYGGVNTLVHADMWSNNLLIKMDGSDKIGSIIDWQIACIGNPLFDICSFIILCTNVEERKECEKKVIDFYYDELCRHYKRHNSQPKFTREQAYEFYNVAIIQQAVQLITTFTVHVISMDKSEQPKDKHERQNLIERLRYACYSSRQVLQKYDLIEKCKK